MEPGRERDELSAALEREGYTPVYLDQNTVDLHYNGFCNTVLWQLFHYVPLNIGQLHGAGRGGAGQGHTGRAAFGGRKVAGPAAGRELRPVACACFSAMNGREEGMGE